MRVVALEAMEALEPFLPRLIGSVATGHVRSGSDVDLHVFAWDAADVEAHVRALGWAHETQRVSILKHGKVVEFTHVHVPDLFPLELTVYAPNELAHRPRSSTDGKPIVRVRESALRALCAREHAELWARYLADGSTPTLEEILAAEDAEDPPSIDELVSRGDEDLVDGEAWIEDEEPEAGEALVEDEPEREPRIRRPPRGARRHRVAQGEPG